MKYECCECKNIFTSKDIILRNNKVFHSNEKIIEIICVKCYDKEKNKPKSKSWFS